MSTSGFSRGNSLFSEVDDRRKVVEDKLKRQNDKMEEMRALSENKSKQLAKAQMQNLALLKKRPELGAGGVVGGSLLGGRYGHKQRTFMSLLK